MIEKLENEGPGTSIFLPISYFSISIARGPALSGVCLGIRTDFSQTRGRARLPTRRPSNADKTLRSPTQLATARGTTKPDSERHVVVSVEAANSAAHGDVDHTPMKSWSDRGLQVLDLKAAGTLSSSAVTGATYTWSHTNMLALPCMHHAPPVKKPAAGAQDQASRCSESHSSSVVLKIYMYLLHTYRHMHPTL